MIPTWLNLGAQGLTCDVRRLIYRWLNPLDKLMVEAAHCTGYATSDETAKYWCNYQKKAHEDRCECLHDTFRQLNMPAAKYCRWVWLKYWCAMYDVGTNILLHFIEQFPHVHDKHSYGQNVWYNAMCSNNIKFMNTFRDTYEKGRSKNFWWFEYKGPLTYYIKPDTTLETFQWFYDNGAVLSPRAYDIAFANDNTPLVEYIEKKSTYCYRCGSVLNLVYYSSCGASKCYDFVNGVTEGRTDVWSVATYGEIFRVGNLAAADRLLNKYGVPGGQAPGGVYISHTFNYCVSPDNNFPSENIITALGWCDKHKISVIDFSILYLRAGGWVLKRCSPYNVVATSNPEDYKKISDVVDYKLLDALRRFKIPISQIGIQLVLSQSLDLFEYCRTWLQIPLDRDDFIEFVIKGDRRIFTLLFDEGKVNVTHLLLEKIWKTRDYDLHRKVYKRFCDDLDSLKKNAEKNSAGS